MPRYDLNGDPMPDDPAPAPPAAPAPQQPVGVGQPGPTPGQQPVPPYGLPPQPGYQPGYTQSLQAARKPTTTFDGKQFRFTDEKPPSTGETAGKIAAALVGALILAILGSIGIMKIVLLAARGFTALYVVLGFGVGIAVSYGIKNKVASVGVAFLLLAVGLFVGHLTFAQDMIHQHPDDFGGVPLMTAFPQVMGVFNLTHWMLVAFSFVGCLRAAAMKVGN